MADYPPVTIWPILHYDDTEAALDFLVEVLGFREALIARDESQGIVHAELRWPAGGTILFGSTKHLDSVHGQIPRGASAMYVPTDNVLRSTNEQRPPAPTSSSHQLIPSSARATTPTRLRCATFRAISGPSAPTRERHEPIGLRPNPAPLR